MMRDRGDLRETLQNKAHDLFALCDPEGKGYATQTDLHALRGELPLPPAQLDLAFEALDVDGDGKLTLQEFTDGFGIFLGIETLTTEAEEANETEDEEEMLEELLDHLGARNLFTDEEYVREMWRRVRKEDPVMRSNFENFISKMAADLKDSARERKKLQTTLNSRRQSHEAQVQSLYIEMEEQLRIEKEKILEQEQRKEQRLRDELETELQLKDQQLRDLLEKHAQMESQLAELNSDESEQKYENKKLQNGKDALESRLAASERMLHEMKSHLTVLRKKSLDERRKRAQAAFKVSEGIALEREDLVMELCHLKQVNKQLQDEKDELALGTVQMIPVTAYSSAHSNFKKRIERHRNTEKDIQENVCNVEDHQQTTDSETSRKVFRTISLDRTRTESHPLSRKDSSTNTDFISHHRLNDARRSASENSIEDSEMEGASSIDSDIQNNLNYPRGGKSVRKYEHPTSPTRYKSRLNSTASNTPRKSSLQYKLSKRKSVLEDAAPTRVFKVVFVGDSGVGKTSILQRFCTDSFKSTFSATIGVDFQVKTIEVDGERIALQLWDTAGQERFRSMTHQYFRKADGIIVAYDVTSETSFRNVRNWMHNIQDSREEGAQDGVMVLLMGNKVDLCDSEGDRVVRTKDGTRLADEYGSLFFETSAKTGDSISEAIEGLASILKTKEDEAIEHVLKLQEVEIEKRKKRCC